MYRIMTFDPARGMRAYNDYSCICVMGFDRFNCLWVLDMWLGRDGDAALLNRIWSMGFKWDVKLMGIESVSMQVNLFEKISTIVAERAGDTNNGWLPFVVPVNYEGVRKDKPGRIGTLEWRFPMGLIKYPGHLQNKWPWTQLYSQTKDFTYDLALLPHDDAIDAVAMGHYVTHGKGIRTQPAEAQQQSQTIEQMIVSGQTHYGGLSLPIALGSQGATPEILGAILDKRAGQDYTGSHALIMKRPRGLRMRRIYGLH
jgi:hypothetical protein